MHYSSAELPLLRPPAYAPPPVQAPGLARRTAADPRTSSAHCSNPQTVPPQALLYSFADNVIKNWDYVKMVEALHNGEGRLHAARVRRWWCCLGGLGGHWAAPRGAEIPPLTSTPWHGWAGQRIDAPVHRHALGWQLCGRPACKAKTAPLPFGATCPPGTGADRRGAGGGAQLCTGRGSGPAVLHRVHHPQVRLKCVRACVCGCVWLVWQQGGRAGGAGRQAACSTAACSSALPAHA